MATLSSAVTIERRESRIFNYIYLWCFQYGYRPRDYCAMSDWTEYQQRYITSAHTYVDVYVVMCTHM